MSTTKPKKGKAGGQKPYKKIVKVPQTIKLAADSGVTSIGNKELPEAFVVCVSVPGHLTRQLTFHHPVGITPLSRDVWICTPSSEVQDLLNRKSHPQEVEITAKRKAHKRAAAVSKGLLVVKESSGVSRYYYPSGDERNEALNDAKKAFKAETQGKKNVDPLLTSHSFLSDNNRESELKLQKFYKDPEVNRAAEEKYPLPSFETCSGALANHRQVELSMQASGPMEAMDHIVSQIAARVVHVLPVATASGGTLLSRGRSKLPSRGGGSRSKSTK